MEFQGEISSPCFGACMNYFILRFCFRIHYRLGDVLVLLLPELPDGNSFPLFLVHD